MKILALILLSLSSVLAFAGDKISCFIETPCSWLDPIPGITDHYLGYCVTDVIGNRSELTVNRTDRDGRVLPAIPLTVTVFSKMRIDAVNPENQVTLNVSQYGDFWAGGLLIKTLDSPAGLGFYTSCREE